MLIHRPRSMLAVWLALIVSGFLSLGGCATSSSEDAEGDEELSLQNSQEQSAEIGDEDEDGADLSENSGNAQFEDQEFMDQNNFGEDSLGEENNNFANLENNNNGSDLLGNEISNQENQFGAIVNEDPQFNSLNQEVVTDNLENAGNSLADNSNDAPMEAAPTFGTGGLLTGISPGPAAETLPEIGSKLVYVVVKGDTLAKISSMIYGSSSMWKKMADLSGIADPNVIFPGDLVYYQLTEQAISFAAEYEGMPKVAVTTKAATSLQKIAQEQYGTQTNWKHIWRQNAHIANPFRLHKGTKVTMVAPKALASIKKTVLQRRSVDSLKKATKSAPRMFLTQTTDEKQLQNSMVHLGGKMFDLGIKTAGLIPQG